MLCRADLPCSPVERIRGEAGGGGGIEQMTLRLMLCALILLALGGCQNPSRIAGRVVRFRGDGLMALKLRPTGLGSGIDKDRPDYTVYSGEWDVGRIYQTRGGPEVCAGSGR